MTLQRLATFILFLGPCDEATIRSVHDRYIDPSYYKLRGLIAAPELNYYPVEGECPIRDGPFEDIKRQLDFNWHGCYPEWRFKQQDLLVRELMSKRMHSVPGTEPPKLNGQWVVFTAGAMGVGKGYVMTYLLDKGYMLLDAFHVVDPDTIRMALPEWNQLVELNIRQAGSILQKESGYLAEILREALIRRRDNVIVDGSLRDTAYAIQDIERLKARGVKIGVIHITGDLDTMKKQAEARETRTGRYVAPEWIEESFHGSQRSFDKLSSMVDFAVQIYNPGNGIVPQLNVVKIQGTNKEVPEYKDIEALLLR